MVVVSAGICCLRPAIWDDEPERRRLAFSPARRHIPHGFFEKQLLGYFAQFGKVTRVRLSRNKKTGKYKHYAFVEFQHPEVAVIAAETMNGYMMFTQKLVCRVVPVSEQHPLLFKGANRTFTRVPWRKLEAERVNRVRTPEEHAKRINRLLKRDNRRERRIKEAGIDYEFKGYEDKLPKQPKKIKFDS